MIRNTLVALLLGALLAGCGGQVAAKPDTAKADAPPVDVSVLRGAHYDFAPAATPEELIRERHPDVVAIGEVEGVEQGRDLIDETDPLPVKKIIMRVRVTDEILAGKAGLVPRGRVHVELDQGGFVATDDRPRHTLADFRKAIPKGARVMLFLHDQDAAKGFKVTHARRGLPDGARLLQPDVQGIIFENPGELVGGLVDTEHEVGGEWTKFGSLDEIGDRVKRHLG